MRREGRRLCEKKPKNRGVKMPEKNIDAEIKRKHAEFDRDIEDYLKQFRMRKPLQLSPAIQGLRRKASVIRRR